VAMFASAETKSALKYLAEAISEAASFVQGEAILQGCGQARVLDVMTFLDIDQAVGDGVPVRYWTIARHQRFFREWPKSL
jgi:hypothetical protein